MKIPQQWTDLLVRIRRIAPSAILAGGALRDLDNGRPVKDLDVFISEPVTYALFDELEDAGFIAQGPGCGGSYIDAAKEVQMAHRFSPHWWATFDSIFTKRVDIPELNIIELAADFDSASIVNRVDFGLCQISYDGCALYHTDAYEHDKLLQRFTLTRGESQAGFDRSMKRYERLRQKYPGWSLVIPREFFQFAGIIDPGSATSISRTAA